MNPTIEIITQRKPQPFLSSWYELATDSHFWFRWRMAAILSQLRELSIPLDQNLRALEVGCATGVLRSQFESATNWTVDGSDLDYVALCNGAVGRGRTLYYDIEDRAPEFSEFYDVVILFDVLEHIADTQSFVGSVLQHLKPGGLLLVNVPALPSLYSRFDKAARHFRRYDQSSLRREFGCFDFEIIDLRYWGFSLLPLLVLRGLILNGNGHDSSEQIIRRGFKPPSALINKFMAILMHGEIEALRKPPLGSSLLMVGSKRRTPVI